MIALADSEVAIGVMAIFLRQVGSQLRVIETNPEQHAFLAWNTLWDAVLLSALFDCEAVCNFQGNSRAEDLSEDSDLKITNFHLRGLASPERILDESECDWIEANFRRSRDMLKVEVFQNAVHCMASYRWHSHPRARLAIIWAGIEGLFNISSELVFRLSLYVSRFLQPDDIERRRALFKHTKKLYVQRSKAVHGSKIKGDANTQVEDAAALLGRLIRACIEGGGIPDGDKLAP